MLRASILAGVDASELFNASPNPYVILDRDLVMVGMNEAYLRVTGRTRGELFGRNMFEAFPSDPASPSGRMLRASLARVLAERAPDALPLIPYAIAAADGTMAERFWSATHTPLLDERGEVKFILQHTVDVTELHLRRAPAPSMQVEHDIIGRADAVQSANMLLDEERAYLRGLLENAPSFMAVLRGPEHVFEIANAAYAGFSGRSDFIGRTVREALPDLADQGLFDRLDRVFATGETFVGRAVAVRIAPQPDVAPEVRFVDVVYQPIRSPAGEVSGIFMQGHDVTEQKRAEQAARDSEAHFRTLAQSMPNHVWTARPDGQLDWFNEQVYRFSGTAPSTLDGDGWVRIVHPDDVPGAARVWETALTQGKSYETEFRLRRHDGAWRWHIARAVPIHDDGGAIVRWIGTNTDIEDQKRAEAALAELNATLEQRVEARTAELARIQETLRQSQKMEAIGNLAGGIAHDFNNLLQVIGGSLQLLSGGVAGDQRAEQQVRYALAGVARGAKLASHLLAFGRRQPLEPKVVNVGRLIRNMDDILRRTLGEGVDIETVVAAGLWHTLIDPANVESALLNMAINARDAMDGRGRLTIEAGNAYVDDAYARANVDVVAGQYVVVAVTDTGCGMTPETIANAFEPFFTTKPAGKGTGLGLSMVYGFVKQSGGHVKIYSEPGRGTTIRLYLPRSMQSEDRVVDTAFGPVVGGSETILVAEDDGAVRATAVAMLSELGYRILKANDAESALAIVDSGVAIDLLFSDVVMPGPLSGAELARKARERQPGLKVLFTSGYTENSIVHGGRLDAGVNLLSKPYSREALAAKIRQVLGSDSDGTAASPPGADGPRAAKPQPAPPGSTRPPTPLAVVLCEDDPLIRMSTADMLREIGCTVVEAASAGAALEALSSQRSDILLTDIGLPDMSGVELARRAVANDSALAVIFATGHAEAPGAAEIADALMLSKPYDSDALASIIARAMDRAAPS